MRAVPRPASRLRAVVGLPIVGIALAVAVTVAACSGGDDGTSVTASALLADRVAAIDAAVGRWESATDLVDAKAAAEEAANLIVGPGGPGFGDRDGDGAIGGDVLAGLLSGAGGQPEGVAARDAAVGCVRRDVLGDAADDPDAGWSAMVAAIEAWTPDDNTMPSLPSHPMRVVGWATFTLHSDDLDQALEYAGHARLHVRVTQDAVAGDC